MNCVDCIEELIESKKLERKSFYRKIEVYVNVEPCIMCASALLQLEASHSTFHCSSCHLTINYYNFSGRWKLRNKPSDGEAILAVFVELKIAILLEPCEYQIVNLKVNLFKCCKRSSRY